MDNAQVNHYLDVALQQSVMVAFTVPTIGPALAAGFSILDAILQESRTNPIGAAHFSVETAFSDLYKQIETKLDNDHIDDADAAITACQHGITADENTIDRALNDDHFWDDKYKLHALDQDVNSFHSEIGELPIMQAIAWIEGQTDETLVKSLDLYMIARSVFQKRCIAKLHIQALILQKQSEQDGCDVALPEYYDTHHELIDDVLQSLSDAIVFMDKKLAHLENVFAHGQSMALAEAVKQFPKPGLKQQQAFTSSLRKIGAEAHTDVTSHERVTKMREMLTAFQRTYVGLNECGVDAIKKHQRDAITNTKPATYDPLGN